MNELVAIFNNCIKNKSSLKECVEFAFHDEEIGIGEKGKLVALITDGGSKNCYGKKVEVFCLGRSGDLEERLYEEDQPVVTEQVVPTTVEPKQETKKNWMPVILTSAACFAAGIVTDKYGKQIMNTIVKAIA